MELAERIVGLTIDLPEERLVLFVKVYYDTMIREWGGIDRIRMDKYMSFVRKMIHATLKYLQAKEWNLELVTQVSKVLAGGVLNSTRTDCRGLFLHFTDVYLVELCKVLADAPSVPFEAFQQMTSPLYTSLCTVIDKTLVRRVNDNLMAPLITLCRAVNGHEELASDDSNAPLLVVLDGHVGDMVTHFFTLASAPTTLDKQRAVLYRYHNELKQCLASPAERKVASAPTTIPAAPANPQKRAKKAAAAAAADTVAVDETEDSDGNNEINDSDDESSPVAAVAAPRAPVAAVKLGKRKEAATSMATQGSEEHVTRAHPPVAAPLDAFLLKKLKQTFPAASTAAATTTESKIPLFAAKSSKKTKTTPAVAAAETVAPAPSTTATPRTARKKSVRFEGNLENVKHFDKFNPTSPGETTMALLGKSPAKTNLKPATPVFARNKRVIISTPPSPHVAAAAAGYTPHPPRAEDYFMTLQSPQ